MNGIISNPSIGNKYSFSTPITANIMFRPCIGSIIYTAMDWNTSSITIRAEISSIIYWCIIAISY